MTNLKYSAVNGNNGIDSRYDCDAVYCHQSKTILVDMWEVATPELHSYAEFDVEYPEEIESEIEALATVLASRGPIEYLDAAEQAELADRLADLWNA